jgi:TRAP-type C4-dicarboxylate transport system permease small subunit
MKKVDGFITKLSHWMAAVAGLTLMFAMLLTVVDVILRYFGSPITGVYDFVALCGSIIIGFSVPYAAKRRIHVFMEMFQVRSRIVKQLLEAFTRLLAFAISLLIGWNLVSLGMGYMKTGEASLTVQVAYYPIAFGLAVCFFLQTLIFAVQFVNAFSGGSHE